MAFGVLRCAKVKANDVSKVHNHNFRTYENHSAENINFERNQNKLVLGSSNTHSKLKENLSKLESKKAIRKDANVLLEFIFSASPDFFYNNLDKEKFDKLTMKDDKKELDKIFNENLNKENLSKFEKSVVEFINSKPEFKDNVVNLVLHLDEKTPHYHLTLTPILNKRLTAKTFFTPDKARTWQDDFHNVLQKNNIDLKRGREHSSSIHQTLAEYRSNDVIDMPKAPQIDIPSRPQLDKLGTKVLLTEKIITTKTELNNANKQLKNRETVLLKKYSFYKNQFTEMQDVFVKAKLAIKENTKLKERNEYLKKGYIEMQDKFKKFTDKQLEDLRQIPLVEVALKLGFNLTESKNGYARFKNENMNLVIDEKSNSYSENKNNVNGFGAINFLKDLAGLDFKRAVDFLGNDFNSVNIAREVKQHSNAINVIFNSVNQQIAELPKEVSNNTNNIFKYLTERRKIEPSLVKELLDSKKLYADKFNNCVFVNEENNFAYVRGTHTEKRFVANKGQMNFLKYQNESNPSQIFLFESVIDLLSYRTLNPNKKGIFVSVQGSAMANRFKELELDKFDKVICCFDNDEQGNKFDLKIKAICKNAIIEKSKGKDFNDDLIEKQSQIANKQIQDAVEKIQQTKINFGIRKKGLDSGPRM